MVSARIAKLVMPEISVVIPTYNRASRLKTCLEALTLQTQSPKDFEVIVVVDGSTDETWSMLSSLETPFTLRPVWQENKGQPEALNRGVAEASGGQYCLFLDDDIISSPQLVEEHLRAQRKNADVVGIGHLDLSLPFSASWYARAFAQSWEDHYNSLNHTGAKITWEDCYSGNLSVPRDKLLACGGFATDLPRGYDVELVWRLEKEGCSFIYLPEATGRQDERKDFNELSKDAENSGMVDVTLYQRDQHMLSQALASFPSGGWRKLLLRRFLLSFRISPKLIWLLVGNINDPKRKYTWHSFIQNLFYWRGVRKAVDGSDLWTRLTSGTPILMYHAVGSNTEKAGTYVIPAARLASHLTWIKRLGYQVISLDQYINCIKENRFPPVRSVVITFDDGYLDNYTSAYPILRNHGMPITIFLVTNFVGQTNQWDMVSQLSGRPIMNWNQIKELAEQGTQFGAHSCTHKSLITVTPAQASAEINQSREHLERELGIPIAAFAYPYGDYNQSIQIMVKQAGFNAGCTVDAGLNSLGTPSEALHRVEIQGTDSIIRLGLALWLGDADAIWRRKQENHQNTYYESTRRMA
jgi:peptidoglycan/xylan/chitin deacetylase (PgdA/CDA1 family)/glycosyltransferase involved in cell wall biosynthesis